MSKTEPGAASYSIEQLTDNFGFYLQSNRLLAEQRSDEQHIEILETSLFGRAMRIDGCFMTSERDEFFYHEPMIHLPAIAFGGPRSALVIGGGDGGSIEELLKYPTMQRVVLAELDAEVIDMSREWLPSISNGAFDDPRLEIKLGDGKLYLEESEEKFDQIVLDLTDPFGPAVQLYTAEFYETCRKALNPGGVISLHIQSPIHRPDTLARIVASLRCAFPIVRPYMQYVPLYGTQWAMAMASDSTDPLTLIAEEVDKRIQDFGLQDLQLYNGAMHQALLAQPNYLRELLAKPAEPIRAENALQDPSLQAENFAPLTIQAG